MHALMQQQQQQQQQKKQVRNHNYAYADCIYTIYIAAGGSVDLCGEYKI